VTDRNGGSDASQLIAPTLRLHDSWLESREEWGRGVHQHGAGLWVADDLDLDTREGFSAWIERLRRESDMSIPLEPGKVHATYWWISEADAYLGAITLRHDLNAFLLEAGGTSGTASGPRPAGAAMRPGLCEQCCPKLAPSGSAGCS
jgi:predicted acetyltransferase